MYMDQHWSVDLAARIGTHVSQEVRDLRSDTQEVFFPEFVAWVAEQLDEGDNQSPRMRTMDEEAFEQHGRDDFLELARVDLVEEVQHQRAEPVRVGIRVS